MKDYIPLSVPVVNTGNELKYVTKCIETGWVSSAGSFVRDFEGAIKDYVGSRYAVACINGTSALFVALKVLGVGPGDEVIVPSLTFIAPVNAVRYVGAEPVFMDCDDYMNIDCGKLGEFCANECRMTRSGLVNRKTGRRVAAVIPVHVFGNPCDMEWIRRIAVKARLRVIEDSTESLGSRYTAGACRGRFAGTASDIGIYSFNGNKIITTGGGGMIVTDKAQLAEKARYIVDQAKDDAVRYIHNEVGYNFRLTNLQAALGMAQLEKLERFIRIKKRNYALYRRLLAGVDGLELLGTPEGTDANHWFYSMIIERSIFGKGRDYVMRRLQDSGIQTRPVWYPNHLQKPYAACQAYKIEKTIWFWQRVLNLPCSSDLRLDQVEHVASAIKKIGNGGKTYG
jgi:perosamine synthetase